MTPGPRRSTGSSPTTRKRRPRLGDVPMKVGSGKATVIRGGRLLDVRGHRADPADLLVVGDAIREVGAPGLKAPAGAVVIDARGKLLHPGLINGGRSIEDKYLSAKLGAVEMVLKGCTAAYDLAFEWPAPTPEGLDAVGRAYADVGMRAVIAPMVADRTFYEAIPGLMDVLTPGLRNDVAKLRLGPWKTSVANMRKAFRGWTLDRDQ